MPTPAPDVRDGVETWEVVEGANPTVWVWVSDPREPSRYRKQRVGGPAGGSRRLRISTDDRKYNEEQIIEEMQDHNPFRNGLLQLVSAARSDVEARHHLGFAELRRILSLREPELFEERVNSIDSELVLRRLKALAESEATVAQLEFVNRVIDERYKAGGTQRTVRELLAAGEQVGGQLLSG